MGSPAGALLIDSAMCLAFLEPLAHLSLSDIQALDCAGPRQLLILEDHINYIPTSFVDLSARITARSDFRRLFPSIVALKGQCESAHCLRATLHWIVGFGHTLTSLSLRLPTTVAADVQTAALRTIRGKVPYLQRLNLETDLRGLTEGQALDLALQVVAFCDDLRSLTTLSLPVEVLETAWQVYGHGISGLPHLQELQLITRSRIALSRRPPTRSGGFNGLQSLRIRAPMFQCADIVGATNKNISRLDIRCDFLEHAHAITGTLRSITNFCSSASATPNTFSSTSWRRMHPMSPATLSALFSPHGIPAPVLVSNLTDVALIFMEGTPEGGRLTIFAPLLSACNMRRLSIRYPYALSYTPDDLGDMLGSWLNIESLHLNPRPTVGLGILSSLPPLAILSVVARCGPCLRDFRALLEGLGTERPLPERTWAPSLVKLDLGYSLGTRKEEDVLETAKYIRSLFRAVDIDPEDCSEWVVDVVTAFRQTVDTA